MDDETFDALAGGMLVVLASSANIPLSEMRKRVFALLADEQRWEIMEAGWQQGLNYDGGSNGV